jgi:hypothetical protein
VIGDVLLVGRNQRRVLERGELSSHVQLKQATLLFRPLEALGIEHDREHGRLSRIAGRDARAFAAARLVRRRRRCVERGLRCGRDSRSGVER